MIGRQVHDHPDLSTTALTKEQSVQNRTPFLLTFLVGLPSVEAGGGGESGGGWRGGDRMSGLGRRP